MPSLHSTIPDEEFGLQLVLAENFSAVVHKWAVEMSGVEGSHKKRSAIKMPYWVAERVIDACLDTEAPISHRADVVKATLAAMIAGVTRNKETWRGSNGTRTQIVGDLLVRTLNRHGPRMVQEVLESPKFKSWGVYPTFAPHMDAIATLREAALTYDTSRSWNHLPLQDLQTLLNGLINYHKLRTASGAKPLGRPSQRHVKYKRQRIQPGDMDV